ncbi:MAG: phage holin family protein [Mycobacterium sp.]
MSKPTDGIEPGDAPTKALTVGAPAAFPPRLAGPVAGVAGVALLAAGVWGLHAIAPTSGAAGSVGWVVLLLAAFTALSKGISLLRQSLAPVVAAVSASVAGIPAVVRAIAGIIIGAAGVWWVMRGHAGSWLTQVAGTDGWSLPSRLVQVAMIAVAGALLFGGGKALTNLLLSNSGTRQHNQDEREEHSRGQDRWTAWWASHPGLGIMLLAGGAALIFLSRYVVPRVSGWLTGDDPMAALSAIAAVLTLALAADTWWWRALSGWWTWAHTPNGPGGPTPMGQIYAGAGVLALIMFSATAFGLATFSSYLPQSAVVASADPCGPDGCGGGGNSGPQDGGQMFQPPQMPNQMPDYQGGINQPPLDQNGGVSIYNPSTGQGGSQAPQNLGPQMSGQHATHGEPLPNYGPWQPDAQPPAQAPVQQAPQPVQQAPAQQPAQAPQNSAGQQPMQQAPQQPVQQAPQQPGPQQPQGQPGQQPQPPQVPKQPEQVPPTQPDTPKKSPIDPTDLAVAATRRGSQHAGQQAAQQGTAQAVSKSSQVATQMSGTATNMSGPAPMEPPTPSPSPDSGGLWQPSPPQGPTAQTGNWVDPNTGQLISHPPSFQPNTGNPPQTSTPTQGHTEAEQAVVDRSDQVKWLADFQKLSAEIAEHNAHPVFGTVNDPAVTAYNAEAAKQNADMLALQADAGRMTLPDIPIAVLQQPNR